MIEYKVKVSQYVDKDTFIIRANNEEEAKKLALKQYDEVGKSYSINVREVGVNGD